MLLGLLGPLLSVGQYEHNSHHSTVHPTANFSAHLKCCCLFWQCEPAISGRFLARINRKVRSIASLCKTPHHLERHNNTSLTEIHNPTLTCVILSADAGVASLPASTHSSIHAGVWVTQVYFNLAVISGKSGWAAAAQACDGMDGPEQRGRGGDKGSGAVEAEDADALHVVLTWLTQAHVIIKWENLP